MIEVLVITISKPVLVGIYENKQLIEEIQIEGKTSDELPSVFQKLLKKYDIKNLYYVNTPGSFMAIKVAYVFLKTISISKNIPLFACSGFEFNGNSPIKALGKKYFIKDENDIKVDFIENNAIIHNFKLPKNLGNIEFNENTLPIYNLPAV
ncbi:MAG: Uncharacterised protein [Arcobacter lacus]|nr:MAG: Uncharacterised protein [Arcobacter lacus]